MKKINDAQYILIINYFVDMMFSNDIRVEYAAQMSHIEFVLNY